MYFRQRCSLSSAVCASRQSYPLLASLRNYKFDKVQDRCYSSGKRKGVAAITVDKPKAVITTKPKVPTPVVQKPEPKAVKGVSLKYPFPAVRTQPSLVSKNDREVTTLPGNQLEKNGSVQKPDYVFVPGDTQMFELPIRDTWYRTPRVMGYAIYGSKRSIHPPILHNHGIPGSRLDGYALHEWACNLGLTVISVERPGCGISTFQKGITVLDFAKDMISLMEHLGHKKYYAYGVSGGGPYALALAYLLSPSTLLGTGIMCGSTPPGFERALQSSRRYWDDLTEKLIFPWYGVWISGRRLDRHKAWQLPPTSKFEEKQRRKEEENFRQGPKGYVYDYRRINLQWGFKLEDIVSKRITWYAGDMDRDTPISGARAACARLKNHGFRPFEGFDHNSAQQHTFTLLREMLEKGKSGI